MEVNEVSVLPMMLRLAVGEARHAFPATRPALFSSPICALWHAGIGRLALTKSISANPAPSRRGCF